MFLCGYLRDLARAGFQMLPLVFDHKLGLVDADKKSLAMVVAPLVSLMVDQVQSHQAKVLQLS